MKLDIAIKTLKDHLAFDDPPIEEDRRAAVLLGIEALKRLQQLRCSRITWFRGPLPGETKD